MLLIPMAAHCALTFLQRILLGLQIGDAPDVDPKIRLERVLLYSFDTLSSIEQQMFLDAATVLAGQPQHLALAVWKAWHMHDMQPAFDNLVQRSLLEPSVPGQAATGGLLKMHDVLRYLGRGIVLGRGRYPSSYSTYVGSRLFVSRWCEEEDGWEELGSGTQQVDEIFGYVEVSGLMLLGHP
jgi:hypothetical protein